VQEMDDGRIIPAHEGSDPGVGKTAILEHSVDLGSLLHVLVGTGSQYFGGIVTPKVHQHFYVVFDLLSHRTALIRLNTEKDTLFLPSQLTTRFLRRACDGNASYILQDINILISLHCALPSVYSNFLRWQQYPLGRSLGFVMTPSRDTDASRLSWSFQLLWRPSFIEGSIPLTVVLLF
jgi:hypothetical protein